LYKLCVDSRRGWLWMFGELGAGGRVDGVLLLHGQLSLQSRPR
jgi:hypothetical protein